MEVPNSKEVNDPVLQDVAADLIRQIVMAFFTHPRSPYYTDPVCAWPCGKTIVVQLKT